MSGCGGKMQKGGALKPLGAKIGVGTNVAAMIGTGIKAISDRIKAKEAEKKEKQAALDKKQMGGVTKGNWQFNKDGSLKTFESERAKNKGTGLKRDDKYKKIQEDIEKRTGKKSSLKYQKGGIAKQEIVGMPGYNARTDTMKKGGSAKKFAALAPPYDKATYADKIVGAKKKAKFGASVPVQHSPSPGRVRSSSGVGTVPVGARKQMGGSTKRK